MACMRFPCMFRPSINPCSPAPITVMNGTWIDGDLEFKVVLGVGFKVDQLGQLVIAPSGSANSQLCECEYRSWWRSECPERSELLTTWSEQLTTCTRCGRHLLKMSIVRWLHRAGARHTRARTGT
jgi:hypothetical protein